jgi:hypothetical protein
MGVFYVGYVIFIGCLLAAAWRLDVLRSIGAFWTVIALFALLGIGLMVGVRRAGSRIELEQR